MSSVEVLVYAGVVIEARTGYAENWEFKKGERGFVAARKYFSLEDAATAAIKGGLLRG